MDVREAIEAKLKALYEEGEVHVNDGDCDLVADAIAEKIEGLTDHDAIRAAVRAETYEQAEAGMFGEPHLHGLLADVALAALPRVGQ